MAEPREQLQPPQKKEEEVPDYFAALGTCSPKPRQKYGGMFCNVEGAFENKTLDFESLGGGRRGSSNQKLSRGDLSQLSSGSEGQSEASSGSQSTPVLTPAGPPSVGVAEELSNGCHQVTGEGRRWGRSLEDMSYGAKLLRVRDKAEPALCLSVPHRNVSGMYLTT